MEDWSFDRACPCSRSCIDDFYNSVSGNGLMGKYILRACPRCKGDLKVDKDEISCVQCGHAIYLKEVPSGK